MVMRHRRRLGGAVTTGEGHKECVPTAANTGRQAAVWGGGHIGRRAQRVRADDGTYIGRQASNVEFEACNLTRKEATNNSVCASFRCDQTVAAVWEIPSFKKHQKYTIHLIECASATQTKKSRRNE